VSRAPRAEKRVRARYRMPLIGSGTATDPYRPKYNLGKYVTHTHYESAETVVITAKLTAGEEKDLLANKDVEKLA